MEQICKICTANGRKLGPKSFNHYDIISLLPELILRQAVCSVQQHHVVFCVIWGPSTISESQKYKSYFSEAICQM